MKLLRLNGFFSHWHLSVAFIHLILVQESTCHLGTSIRKVCKKHGLSLILLHGSRVVGLLHKQSDTDIAVVREKEIKKVDLLNLLSDLKRVFKVEKIDVVDLT